jgi:aminopeptidase YwaD
MKQEQILSKAKVHLRALCTEITDRSVGSRGNREATGYFRDQLKFQGWQVEETPLEVMDWKSDGASLQCGGQEFEVNSSPYSVGCNVQGELTAVSSLKQLQEKDLKGKIVLLHDGIAQEQIMPKNFVFYNPEEHQQIVAALEKSDVAAIVCATGHNPALAGGVYPFPMFEDGDFDIPSVFMKDTEGERLLDYAGKIVHLQSRATRIPETAFNVIGSKPGKEKQRIVITAHIDAKQGSPGAIDNATGVTVLLLLAELLQGHMGKYSLELVAFNGEDYYAVPGQMKYIEQNHGSFADILLNINIDGAGYKEGESSFSPFGLTGEMKAMLDKVILAHPTINEGAPWYQGDHSIFVQSGCPAIAVTSNWFLENMESQDITHTPKDNLGIVNEARLGEIAAAIQEFVLELNGVKPSN